MEGVIGDAEARLNAVRGHADAMSAKAAGLDAVVTHQCERIKDLEAALVYSAFAQHGTPLHMLPKGITLIDDDRVEVVLADGRKVTARSGGGEHGV
jgi:hypothetical protein